MTPEQQTLANAAHVAYGAARYEEALQCFLRATQMNPPGSVELYDMVGHAYAALSRGPEAIQYYKAFVEQNQDSADVWSNLAAFCFNTQDFRTAAHAMGETIRLNGPARDSMLLRFLALYYGAEDDKIPELLDQYIDLFYGDYANTEKFVEYVESHPDVTRRDAAMELYFRAGKHLLAMSLTTSFFFQKRGNMTRAIEVLDEYLRSKVRILQSEFTEAYVQLSELLLAVNDVMGAIRRLQRSLERVRAMTDAHRLARLLGWAHARNGDAHLAGDFYRASAEFNQEARYPLIRTSFAL
jgi:tetratricopeptide (TPR) repeat protein